MPSYPPIVLESQTLPPNYTPPAYFAVSENFSYREWLEQRSHFDQVVLALDRQTVELVGGVHAIAQRELRGDLEAINRSLVGVEDAIKSGFFEANSYLSEISENTARMSEDIFEIRLDVRALLQETEKLVPLLEWGFSNTLRELQNANERLERIAFAVENTDQSWAYSQYNTARKALYEMHLPAEALEYVNRAIEGHQSRSGYPLEPQFLLLRGAIRLGVLECIDLELIDIDAAKADFERAARYSKKSDNGVYGKAMAYLGRAQYCSGLLEDSIRSFNVAADALPNDGAIQFNLSKTLAAAGQGDHAMRAFSKSIRFDIGYAYQAAADADFHLFEKSRVAELRRYKNELLAKLEPYCHIFDAKFFEMSTDFQWDKVPEQVFRLLPRSRKELSGAALSDLIPIERNLSKDNLWLLYMDVRRLYDAREEGVKRSQKPEQEKIRIQGLQRLGEFERNHHFWYRKSFLEEDFLGIALGIAVFVSGVSFLGASLALIYQIPILIAISFGAALLWQKLQDSLRAQRMDEQFQAHQKERDAVEKRGEQELADFQLSAAARLSDALKPYEYVKSRIIEAVEVAKRSTGGNEVNDKAVG